MTVILLAAPLAPAQTTGSPTQTPDQTQSPAPSTAPPSDTQPLPQADHPPLTRDPLAQAQQQGASSSQQSAYPNEQERIRLAREAQARVRARREQRIQAQIQDTYSHKYDIYFGYAFLRIRPGHDLQHSNEYGWNVGVTRYLRPKLGVTADFRGLYTNAYTGFVRAQIPTGQTDSNGNPIYTTLQGNFQPFISNYSFMAGPQYYLRQRKSYAVSAQVLAGVTRNLFNATSAGLPGYYVGLYDNGTRFTAAAAVPIDYNLGPGLAVRVSPTYNLTTWSDHNSGTDIQHNLGFSLGVNYRFGRQ